MSTSYHPVNGKCDSNCPFYDDATNDCDLVGTNGVGEDCSPYLSDLAKRAQESVSTKRPYMPRSKRQDHETPWWLFDLLDMEFEFTVDAAASSKNAKLERYWTEETNGLIQDWSDETIFINPPFKVKDLRLWVERSWVETRDEGTIIVMVVPVKADQDWWHEYAIKTEIRFIKGRVKFEGNEGAFPGPIAVLVFGHDVEQRNMTIKIPRAPRKKRTKK